MLRLCSNTSVLARALRVDLNQQYRSAVLRSVSPVKFVPFRAFLTRSTSNNVIFGQQSSQESIYPGIECVRAGAGSTVWPTHPYGIGIDNTTSNESVERISPADTCNLNSTKETEKELLYYEGDGKEGQVNGTGRLTYPDGRSHEGEFVEGEICSKAGTVTTKDDDIKGKTNGPDKFPLADVMEGPLKWGFKLNVGNGGIYEGAFKNKKYHGQGRFIYPDGRLHEGEFKEGKLWNGSGVMRLKDGNVYEGGFKGGRHHGQGKLTYPDGGFMEGEFKQGRLHNGAGVLPLKHGAIYEGELQKGKRHGQGKITFPDGTLWEGQFAADVLVTGKVIDANGDTLAGEFKDGKLWNGTSISDGGRQVQQWVEAMDGPSVILDAVSGTQRAKVMKDVSVLHVQARLAVEDATAPLSQTDPFPAASTEALVVHFTSKQGVVFDGVYLDASKKHGKGQIKYSDGSVYEGGWLKDKRHGAGRLTSAAGEVFEGVFEKDVPVSGKGVLPFKDGGKYEGELVEGKRHGQGKITYPDGRALEGEFREGRLWNGAGAMTLKNGKFFEGNFKDGAWHGHGKITYPDGRRQEGEYHQGVMWNGTECNADSHVTKRWVEGKELCGTADLPTVVTPPASCLRDKEREQDKGSTEYLKNSSTKPAASSKSQVQQDSPVSIVSAPPAKGASSEATLAIASAVTPANKKGPVYVGERRSGRSHGQGKLTFPDGNVWTGRWEAGNFVEGKITYVDGKTMEGVWVNKVFSHGKIALVNGGWLEGEFKGDILFVGRGKIVLKSGNIYEGEIKGGKMHGQGKLTYTEHPLQEGKGKKDKRKKNIDLSAPRENAVYEGAFVEGERHGPGKITYDSGNTWQGEFLSGLPWSGEKVDKNGNVLMRWTKGTVENVHSDGSFAPAVRAGGETAVLKIRYPDGSVYEGEWLKDKRHGAGRLTSAAGEVFEGLFEHDVPVSGKSGSLFDDLVPGGDGQVRGKVVYPDGSVCEGRWEAGKFVEGKNVHPDGTTFEGVWVNEQFVRGKVTFAHGDWMEGEFRGGNELLSGTGKVTLENGDVYEGSLGRDSCHGQGKISSSDGRSFEGEVKEGERWNGVETSADGQVTRRWIEGIVKIEGPVSPSNVHAAAIPMQFTNKQGAVFDGVYLDKTKKHGKGQIKYLDGSVYEGEWVKEKKHGAGRLTSAAGEVFEGEFEKDAPVSGKGVLPFDDGSVFKGSIREHGKYGQGLMHYQSGTVKEGCWEEGELVEGTIVHPSGHILKGEFREGELWNGTGTLILKNGDVYEGEIKDGQRHGQGKLTHSDGTVSEGKFIENKMWDGMKITADGVIVKHWDSGKVVSARDQAERQMSSTSGKEGTLLSAAGVTTLKDGSVYEGSMQDNHFHGQGKRTFANGTVQEGEFKNNKLWNGSGVLVFKNGTKFEGRMAEGKMHGQGMLTYPDGRFFSGEFKEGKLWNGAGVMIVKNGDVFEGEVKEGKAWNGTGTITHKNGYVYAGELREGKRHGQGKMTYPDGRTLEGIFKEGNLWSGAGVMNYKDGTVYEGIVIDGSYQGQGKFTNADGRFVKGEFRDGKIWTGTGALVYNDGNTYDGEFREGKLWNGTMTGSDGVLLMRWVEGHSWDQLS